MRCLRKCDACVNAMLARKGKKFSRPGKRVAKFFSPSLPQPLRTPGPFAPRKSAHFIKNVVKRKHPFALPFGDVFYPSVLAASSANDVVEHPLPERPVGLMRHAIPLRKAPLRDKASFYGSVGHPSQQHHLRKRYRYSRFGYTLEEF